MRLVLEGGGARAAFTAGVLCAMKDASIPCSSVIGSSTGSMVAAYFASGQTEAMKEIWLEHVAGKRVMNYARLLLPWGRPAVDLDYLVDEVAGRIVPLDREAATAGSPALHVVGTDVRTGEAVLGTPRADNVLPWIKASAAIPVGYNKIVTVDGYPMMDGGVADPVPFERRLPSDPPILPSAPGYPSMVVIITRRLTTRKPPPLWWHRVLIRIITPRHARRLILDQHERHNRLIDRLCAARDRGEVHVVEPPPDMPLVRLTRDRARIAEGLAMGESIGRELARKLHENARHDDRPRDPRIHA